MSTYTGRLPRYSTNIEACDVTDAASLDQYRKKRDQWLCWYEIHPSEPNSIQQQFFSMFFLDLAYRIIAEPRRAPEEKTAAKSGLLIHLLDQGYVANQVLSIRRLLDSRKDVVSPRRLLNDVIDNRGLITRENYVCYDGLPFDSDGWKALPPSPETRVFGKNAPGLANYLGAEHRHEAFDRLSGVPPSKRSRLDLIREGVFDTLNGWIANSQASKFITLSHKFFAHAADIGSRDSLAYSGIQLTDVVEIHHALVRVERAITDQILFIGVARDVIPMPPLGLLKNLDSPYITEESIQTLHAHWERLADERNKWSVGPPENL